MTVKKSMFALIAILAAISCASARDVAGDYIDTFFGLGTELTFGRYGRPAALVDSSLQSLGLTASLGRRSMLPFLPIRARIGLGIEPGKGLSSTLGAELALLEVLNQSHARMFGIYGYLDGILRLEAGGAAFAGRPSIRVLLPLNVIGGVALGAGYDTSSGLTFHIDYLSGFYAMK